MWGNEVIAIKIMKRRGERKWGNGWQRVMREILLLYGRISDLYRDDIYALLSKGNNYKLEL